MYCGSNWNCKWWEGRWCSFWYCLYNPHKKANIPYQSCFLRNWTGTFNCLKHLWTISFIRNCNAETVNLSDYETSDDFIANIQNCDNVIRWVKSELLSFQFFAMLTTPLFTIWKLKWKFQFRPKLDRLNVSNVFFVCLKRIRR